MELSDAAQRRPPTSCAPSTRTRTAAINAATVRNLLRSTPKRAGTCSFFMVAPSSPGPAARCQPRSERGPEAEVRPASAFFAEGIIDAQDAQGRVQADTHTVAGLQVAEADRLAGVERVAKVREDDALHGFHDGEAELRVEHQHPVAGQLAVVVAPYRVGA